MTPIPWISMDDLTLELQTTAFCPVRSTPGEFRTVPPVWGKEDNAKLTKRRAPFIPFIRFLSSDS